MRLFLAILMTVAQIAGPWLCCCGMVRRVAAPRMAVEQPPTPADTDGCCPLCKKHVPAGDEKHRPTAPDQCPGGGCPDRCPCAAFAVLVPADKPELPTFDTLLVVITVELPQPLAVVSDTPREICGLREVPHLTAEDRLFAHHALRC